MGRAPWAEPLPCSASSPPSLASCSPSLPAPRLAAQRTVERAMSPEAPALGAVPARQEAPAGGVARALRKAFAPRPRHIRRLQRGAAQYHTTPHHRSVASSWPYMLEHRIDHPLRAENCARQGATLLNGLYPCGVVSAVLHPLLQVTIYHGIVGPVSVCPKPIPHVRRLTGGGRLREGVHDKYTV
jgi:hypothetical protein